MIAVIIIGAGMELSAMRDVSEEALAVLIRHVETVS